jgi:predicted nucleotidyltransferase
MDPVEELRNRIEAHAEVLFSYLFGSRSRDKPVRPGADWDVAVFFAEELTPEQRFAGLCRLSAELEDIGAVDLVDLNGAPPLLAHRALMGRLLFKRDETAFVRFFVRTLAMSEDERHWRDLHHAARMTRLAEGKFGRP